jgi:hypothetical protein
MMTRLRVVLLLASWVAVTAAGCGDPGLDIYATNHSQTLVLLRFNQSPDVARLPPGATGVALSTIGVYKDLRIDVLREDCSVIAEVTGHDRGPLIVTIQESLKVDVAEGKLPANALLLGKTGECAR